MCSTQPRTARATRSKDKTRKRKRTAKDRKGWGGEEGVQAGEEDWGHWLGDDDEWMTEVASVVNPTILSMESYVDEIRRDDK